MRALHNNSQEASFFFWKGKRLLGLELLHIGLNYVIITSELHFQQCWGSVTCDILVRIWISGSVPLSNGSGSRSDSFLSDFEDENKIFSSYFFLKSYLQSKKFNFLLKFCVKILFCKHYFSQLNTFMRKGKDPDPYLWLIDQDPGGPKTNGFGSGSGSPTLIFRHTREREEVYFLLPSYIPPPPTSLFSLQSRYLFANTIGIFCRTRLS